MTLSKYLVYKSSFSEYARAKLSDKIAVTRNQYAAPIDTLQYSVMWYKKESAASGKSVSEFTCVYQLNIAGTSQSEGKYVWAEEGLNAQYPPNCLVGSCI